MEGDAIKRALDVSFELAARPPFSPSGLSHQWYLRRHLYSSMRSKIKSTNPTHRKDELTFQDTSSTQFSD